jgi:hypothetical protein
MYIKNKIDTIVEICVRSGKSRNSAPHVKAITTRGRYRNLSFVSFIDKMEKMKISVNTPK